jgi:hypothetical protein
VEVEAVAGQRKRAVRRAFLGLQSAVTQLFMNPKVS